MDANTVAYSKGDKCLIIPDELKTMIVNYPKYITVENFSDGGDIKAYHVIKISTLVQALDALKAKELNTQYDDGWGIM